MEPNQGGRPMMTPIEALTLLNNVTEQIPLNRSDHVRVSEAVRILGICIQPAPMRPVAKPDKPTASLKIIKDAPIEGEMTGKDMPKADDDSKDPEA